jgi:hypothetical protein
VASRATFRTIGRARGELPRGRNAGSLAGHTAAPRSPQPSLYSLKRQGQRQCESAPGFPHPKHPCPS